MSKRTSISLAEVRAKLNGARGQDYWRSLDEVAQTPEFEEMLHREFPNAASEWDSTFSRRDFLRLAAASIALAGVAGCTKQRPKAILPYVHQPEALVPGKPMFYATAMSLDGYGTGVIVKNREGHPVKVDGNPEHPAVKRGSSIWMQASILDLYDPDRSQSITHFGEISDWGLFLGDLNELVREHEHDGGAGLRFVSETITSPTLVGQLEALLKKFPKARVYQFDPVCRDNVREGAKLAFGEYLEAHYRFEIASIVVSLESDFLYTHPERLRHTLEYTNGRRLAEGKREMNRLYVAESTPSVTGTMAEHRLPIASGKIHELAFEIARALEGNTESAKETSQWTRAVVADLKRNRGKSVVLAGEYQPPEVHAIAHWINQTLGNVGNTVSYSRSAAFQPANQIVALRDFAHELQEGRVQTVFVLGNNPVYSAPSDFDFSNSLAKVKRSIHIGLDYNETAAVCTWHIPQAHYLESWGDTRSFDGTGSLQQPLIAPLYGGRTIYEVLGAMQQQQPIRTDYEIVRDYWRSKKHWNDFEKSWRKGLHDGFVADTAEHPQQAKLRIKSLAELKPNTSNGASELETVFRPDPSIWDGRFANNGWLQECAKPISKIVWDNAVLVSAALAQRNGLENGDVVEVSVGRRTVHGPIWITPGQAENTLTLQLGYGRQRVGRVGAGVGFDAYQIRTSDALWFQTGAKLTKTGATHKLVTTQTHHNLNSPERQVYRSGTLAEFVANPEFVKQSVEEPRRDETLYDNVPYQGYKWAMSIDLTTCIGCNACLLACNVENNIPVVGKKQVEMHREMYWIRIDTYYKGPLENPSFNHQPVPCMHCEHAPCELVCPVAATVHDHEGLNLQVYNRCVGTRFCSNNCP
ncbi:MAG: molybdopterin oxidoreductase, iron-sulfur binding subunit, partial [Verrucomicrobiales bacterium]|nr:molybdopterin oxidoreductase, iron-sulfur binding subunit [Verrucomicrobiales bacterium]